MKKFTLKKDQEVNITSALKEAGFEFDAHQLLEFSACALQAREFAKFEFTKNLSDAIELIALAGEKMGFTREELAQLDVTEIFSGGSREALTKTWQNAIARRVAEREIKGKLILPPLIFSEKDLDIINHFVPRPNYITQKRVQAEITRLNEVALEVEGRIVMLENGDPGYDWIFTRNPAGLITKYGGVASHMSIRCAEFGIPAAIGCGVLYNQLKHAKEVILDCRGKRIQKCS